MNEELDLKKDQSTLITKKGVKEVYTPIASGLKTKEAIVSNWLPRYTGRPLADFGKYVILTNFSKYIQLFSLWNDGAPILGLDKPMQSVIAAIRGEGTSNDYLPPEVPALPSFALQKAISTTIRDYGRDYFTGTCYTTNRRVWEHDKEFKKYLKELRVMAIDMETATIFITGFANKIPTGALLLVSDQPMIPEGVKTAESDSDVTEKYVETHLHIGIESLKQLINNGLTVKHLIF
jgi:AMP nucleosidase